MVWGSSLDDTLAQPTCTYTALRLASGTLRRRQNAVQFISTGDLAGEFEWDAVKHAVTGQPSSLQSTCNLNVGGPLFRYDDAVFLQFIPHSLSPYVANAASTDNNVYLKPTGSQSTQPLNGFYANTCGKTATNGEYYSDADQLWSCETGRATMAALSVEPTPSPWFKYANWTVSPLPINVSEYTIESPNTRSRYKQQGTTLDIQYANTLTYQCGAATCVKRCRDVPRADVSVVPTLRLGDVDSFVRPYLPVSLRYRNDLCFRRPLLNVTVEGKRFIPALLLNDNVLTVNLDRVWRCRDANPRVFLMGDTPLKYIGWKLTTDSEFRTRTSRGVIANDVIYTANEIKRDLWESHDQRSWEEFDSPTDAAEMATSILAAHSLNDDTPMNARTFGAIHARVEQALSYARHPPPLVDFKKRAAHLMEEVPIDPWVSYVEYLIAHKISHLMFPLVAVAFVLVPLMYIFIWAFGVGYVTKRKQDPVSKRKRAAAHHGLGVGDPPAIPADAADEGVRVITIQRRKLSTVTIN